MSSIHITPYLAMVIAGFGAFILALGYGRMRSMGDPALMQIVDQWIQRADAGLFVTRSEIEEVYADLLPRLTDYRPYLPYVAAYVPQTGSGYDDAAVAALEYTADQQATPYTPPAAGSRSPTPNGTPCSPSPSSAPAPAARSATPAAAWTQCSG